jgi:hypothetical protein
MPEDGPDKLYIRKSDREKYDKLLGDSVFSGKGNKDVFIMAMLVGYYHKARVELTNKEGFVRVEYLKDRDKSIMKAIAVAETGRLDILVDKKQVYTLCEEYAAGGMELLMDMVFGGGYGSFVKKLESELVQQFEKIQENTGGS